MGFIPYDGYLHLGSWLMYPQRQWYYVLLYTEVSRHFLHRGIFSEGILYHLMRYREQAPFS